MQKKLVPPREDTKSFISLPESLFKLVMVSFFLPQSLRLNLS